MPRRNDREEAVQNAPPGSDWARMVALLRYADFAEVARALNTTSSAVGKWYWGKNVGADQLRRVEELLGTQKNAAPGVPARLDKIEKRLEKLTKALGPLDQLPTVTELIGRLEERLRPPAEDPPAKTAGSDPAGVVPPDQGAE